MAALDVESFLAPLSPESPCGADPEYDPAFLALQDAAAGKPEQQFGDTVIAAEPPDWAAIYSQASQLAARTRDLRVAVWLVRSGARVAGWPVAAGGLQVVAGLLTRYWDRVHPLLDASDHNDPTARVSALTPLVHESAGMADLRSASVTGRRGGITVREVELGLGAADALPGEAVPTEGGVLDAVRSATADAPELTASMQSGFESIQQIAGALEQHLEPSQSLEVTPLKKVLQRVSDAARKASGLDADDAGGATAAAGSQPRSAGAIASREDAVRALGLVCEWIERNEPAHPAPLLIRRAQRLMTKSFIDIIRDLAPEGLSQIEKIAGPESA